MGLHAKTFDELNLEFIIDWNVVFLIGANFNDLKLPISNLLSGASSFSLIVETLCPSTASIQKVPTFARN